MIVVPASASFCNASFLRISFRFAPPFKRFGSRGVSSCKYFSVLESASRTVEVSCGFCSRELFRSSPRCFRNSSISIRFRARATLFLCLLFFRCASHSGWFVVMMSHSSHFFCTHSSGLCDMSHFCADKLSSANSEKLRGSGRDRPARKSAR